MSHGGGGEGAACEPNMTPLLDLILQILMFFIVTVNFAQAENTGNVPLPQSQTARPLPKNSLKDPIFMNLLRVWDEKDKKYRHEVVFPLQLDSEGKPLKPMDQLAARLKLKSFFADLSRAGEVRNPVVIRAHRDAEYYEFYQVLQSSFEAGFKNFKLRAMVQ